MNILHVNISHVIFGTYSYWKLICCLSEIQISLSMGICILSSHPISSLPGALPGSTAESLPLARHDPKNIRVSTWSACESLGGWSRAGWDSGPPSWATFRCWGIPKGPWVHALIIITFKIKSQFLMFQWGVQGPSLPPHLSSCPAHTTI